MKKLALTAVAAAALLGAGAASAADFSNGFVVPNTYHNGGNSTTAVGIINRAKGTGVKGSSGVFWSFFDVNSKHVVDGCFEMTQNEFRPFVWKDESGNGLANVHGYLVFATNNSTCSEATVEGEGGKTVTPSGGKLNGSAFQVDTSNLNSATLPVVAGDLTFKNPTNLSAMNEESLVKVATAAKKGDTLIARHFNRNGGNTDIVIWSTGDQRAHYTFNAYDDEQNRRSLSVDLPNKELNFIDPYETPGWDASFVEGFIELTPGLALDGKGKQVNWGSWSAYADIKTGGNAGNQIINAAAEN